MVIQIVVSSHPGQALTGLLAPGGGRAESTTMSGALIDKIKDPLSPIEFTPGENANMSV